MRRSFTPAQKMEHVEAYEAACETSQGGAYLRREGLYSSLITEWRKLRDAGVLAGKQPGEQVGSRPPSRPRSPGCAGNWTGPSAGWRRPRPP